MTLDLRLSVAQVAASWGCSKKHVYNLVNRGELPAIRIGDLYRFRREDIEAYERRGEAQQPKPEPAPVPAPRQTQTVTLNGQNYPPGYLAGMRERARRDASSRDR
jgi:excisionase family DNA binding protein